VRPGAPHGLPLARGSLARNETKVSRAVARG